MKLSWIKNITIITLSRLV